MLNKRVTAATQQWWHRIKTWALSKSAVTRMRTPHIQSLSRWSILLTNITNCVERILNTVRKSQFYLRFTGPLPKLQGTTELDLGNFLKFSLQTTLSLRGTLWYFHDKILSRASISFISMLSSHCVKYRNFT